MMVAPATGAMNKSRRFTAMSHRNTRSWRSMGGGSRGGGSPGGRHASSTYIGVPQLGLSPDNLAAGGDHARAGRCAWPLMPFSHLVEFEVPAPGRRTPLSLLRTPRVGRLLSRRLGTGSLDCSRP